MFYFHIHKPTQGPTQKHTRTQENILISQFIKYKIRWQTLFQIFFPSVELDCERVEHKVRASERMRGIKGVA